MTKHIIHKYDFMQAGFNIDEGWYNINQNNFYIEPYGRTLGGHAVNICGYDEEGVYV
jgi:C1A family cysteine protease